MLEITEEDYAMKFCMLIILDKRKVSGMNIYADNFKYILESYSKILKAHPGLVLKEENIDTESGKFTEQVRMLGEICKMGNINLLLRQGSPKQSELFSILVEAIYRTMILVRYYAQDGDLLTEVLKITYCSDQELSELQICKALNISRATYYRRKQKGILYAGYFFYEAVLPEMEGRI